MSANSLIQFLSLYSVFPSSRIFSANIYANAFAIEGTQLACFVWPLFSFFLYGQFFLFVAKSTMSWIAAALTSWFVVSCFFHFACFVIYMFSYRPTHYLYLNSAFFVPLQSGNSVLPKLGPQAVHICTVEPCFTITGPQSSNFNPGISI